MWVGVEGRIVTHAHAHPSIKINHWPLQCGELGQGTPLWLLTGVRTSGYQRGIPGLTICPSEFSTSFVTYVAMQVTVMVATG